MSFVSPDTGKGISRQNLPEDVLILFNAITCLFLSSKTRLLLLVKLRIEVGATKTDKRQCTEFSFRMLDYLETSLSKVTRRPVM